MDSASDVQRERASGAYELVIDEIDDDPDAWLSLRKALRLSRADAAWLRERVPGTVRKGAREDLEPIAERVRAAGHPARVVAAEV